MKVSRLARAGGMLALCGVTLLAGCGRRQPAEVQDITPSFTINRTRAPLGSAVEVTYTWKTGPGFQAPDQDLRTFVHFLDSHQVMLFEDDHVPEPAPSTWQPNQTYSYTRTKFIPIYPYVGEVEVRMGLTPASGRGERLGLKGQDAGLREYTVGTIELLPQTENIFLVFKDGWHNPEAFPDNPSLERTWTKKEAVVSFKNPGENAIVYLECDTNFSAFTEPPVLTISVGENGVRIPIENSEVMLKKIRLTPEVLGQEEWVDLKLAMNESFVPKDIGLNEDDRELGLLVYHLYVGEEARLGSDLGEVVDAGPLEEEPRARRRGASRGARSPFRTARRPSPSPGRRRPAARPPGGSEPGRILPTVLRRPLCTAFLLLVGPLWCGLPAAARPQSAPDLDAPLDHLVARAEEALRQGELQLAESHYRSVLLEGWLMLGTLASLDGRDETALRAFERAGTSAAENRRAQQSLALVRLRQGDAAEAARIMGEVVRRHPDDMESRRLLAQALASDGRLDLAVEELQAARARAPDDAELAFALAGGYLRIGRVADAEALFAEVLEARPIPQAHVLVGRTYRELGFFERARRELHRALEQDPAVAGAHHQLGLLAFQEEGVLRVDEAIAEFERELELTPGEPGTTLSLGIALALAHRPASALPALERAAAAMPRRVEAFHYLGRCQLALGRTAEAVAALERALQLAAEQPRDGSRAGAIHYQLALALRETGDAEGAAAHFAAAEQASAHEAAETRERLSRYLTDEPDPGVAALAAARRIGSSPAARLSSDERSRLEARLRTVLARAYLNIGVMRARSGRHASAVGLFEAAAESDPTLPGVHYSLGVARFNARQFGPAAESLTRALAERPADAGLRRMLALSWLESGREADAAALLRDDPARSSDVAIQYSYGLALARSGRVDQAREAFAQLLAAHAGSAGLAAELGRAYADQGDYPQAIASFRRALERDPATPGANAAIGSILLRQGHLEQAEAALRAELVRHPGDVGARHQLAIVLDRLDRRDDALTAIREVLAARPGFADARYLLGKILLARGAAAEAAEQLQAASRLAPDDASVRYQLGQAYQRLGRSEEALAQFERFRELKSAARAQERPPLPAAAPLVLAGPPEAAGEVPSAAELRRAAAVGPLDRDRTLELARAEEEGGDLAAASRLLTSAVERFESVRALLQLGRLEARLGDRTAALERLTRALQLAPNAEEVRSAYAAAALAAHSPLAAIVALEPLTRFSPEVAQHHYRLGVALLQVGAAGAAVEALEEALRLEPDRPLVLIAMGLALNQGKRYAEAEGHLRRGLDLEPENVEALAALAEAEHGQGKLALADEHARRALERSGGHATANLVLGMVRMDQERYAEAREALERAVAAEPGLPKGHYQLSLAYSRLGERARSAEELERYRQCLREREATLERLRSQGEPDRPPHGS